MDVRALVVKISHLEPTIRGDRKGAVEISPRPAGRTIWRRSKSLGQRPRNHVSVVDRGNAAVFRTLDSVTEGEVTEGEAVYKNALSRVSIVSPTAVKLPRSDQDALVTLITCTKDLKNRLVVVGKPI